MTITLQNLKDTAQRIKPYVVETPTWTLPIWKDSAFSDFASVSMKLELFQKGGTFKTRGAVNHLLSLSQEEKDRGLVTVSAGNHAIAVAYAARLFKTEAKVYMPRSANAFRVATVKELGAHLTILDTAHDAFAAAAETAEKEGRTLIHPFSSRFIFASTGTLGMEFAQQAGPLDAVIVPIGGGGLSAGVATAFRLLQPECQIFGVEPEGAAAMHRSFAKGSPASIDKISTIADSLGAPSTTPEVLAILQQHLTELVMIDDREIKLAMGILFHEAKLAVEPAGAAAAAALMGPLRQRLRGKRVGIVICGANIDLESYQYQTNH